jgi:hypothetical protein
MNKPIVYFENKQAIVSGYPKQGVNRLVGSIPWESAYFSIFPSHSLPIPTISSSNFFIFFDSMALRIFRWCFIEARLTSCDLLTFFRKYSMINLYNV